MTLYSNYNRHSLFQNFCQASPLANLSTFTFEAKDASLSEHYRFGFEMGALFADRIQARYAAKLGLKQMLEEVKLTSVYTTLDLLDDNYHVVLDYSFLKYTNTFLKYTKYTYLSTNYFRSLYLGGDA